MPVVCTPYVVGDGKWKEVKKAKSAAELKASDEMHAERQSFAKIDVTSTSYLLVQNAYPCHKCHKHFLTQSGAPHGHSVIVKVTENDGQYSADHGLGFNGSVPCIIYYYGGKATYSNITNRAAAPAGFPPHPEFDNL